MVVVVVGVSSSSSSFRHRSGQTVAIKEIHLRDFEMATSDEEDSEDAAARLWKLMAEIDLLRKCTSNYIVQFFDSHMVTGGDGQSLEQLWIVMEYVLAFFCCCIDWHVVSAAAFHAMVQRTD